MRLAPAKSFTALRRPRSNPLAEQAWREPSHFASAGELQDWPAQFEKLLAGRRVAIVHEWFTTWAGSENVVEQFLALFPEADLYAVIDFLPVGERPRLRGRTPITTFLQKIPGCRRFYRALLPLMPLAVESLDLSRYDVILSSSHAVAKGVLTRPGQVHVCYCHTPMRYAWDLQNQYLRDAKSFGALQRAAARVFLHYLRLWDVRTAHGVDLFLANSSYVAARIRKTYRRESVVLHPPVDTEYFQLQERKGDYYVTASRLAPYKCVHRIVEAFAKMPSRRLLVLGAGPDESRCRKLATPNVTFCGHVPVEKLREALQGAKAFVYAAEEDFGIVMAEAQACGTPVICYAEGGSRDIVVPKKTGLLFHRQTAEDICRAVEEFENRGLSYDPAVIRQNAERFSRENFRKRLYRILEQALGRPFDTGFSDGNRDAFERSAVIAEPECCFAGGWRRDRDPDPG